MAPGPANPPDKHEWLKPGAWGCQTEKASHPKRRGPVASFGAPLLLEYAGSRVRPRRSVSRSRVFAPPCWVRGHTPLLVSVILVNVERNKQCAVRALHAGNDGRH